MDYLFDKRESPAIRITYKLTREKYCVGMEGPKAIEDKPTYVKHIFPCAKSAMSTKSKGSIEELPSDIRVPMLPNDYTGFISVVATSYTPIEYEYYEKHKFYDAKWPFSFFSRRLFN